MVVGSEEMAGKMVVGADSDATDSEGAGGCVVGAGVVDVDESKVVSVTAVANAVEGDETLAVVNGYSVNGIGQKQ